MKKNHDDLITSIPMVGDEQLKLIEKLSNACGVSGEEDEVRKIVLEEIKDCVDEVKVDALGNVLAVKKSENPDAIRVMLAAHMDEVGFMLVDESEGTYSFEVIGGVDERQLVGKTVFIGKKHVPGVIGSCPIHLADDISVKIPLKSLKIDTGIDGDKVKAGDRAVFATTLQIVGKSLMGKALDDRLGVATLITLLKQAPYDVEICAAFTVQEENGLRGAKVAAYALNPDIGIAIDSTPANDLPAWDDEENAFYNTKLGLGPAVYVTDGATITDPRLLRYFTSIADEYTIPYQYRQPGMGGTDAGAIHKQRSGIPSISISVPSRNAHTAVSIARISDWQNSISWLYLALSCMSRSILQR